ncbi:MAG: BLUF domain-containing protein [Bacteroidetes bacterium]|jgi:hypothetical protein|nr:BLUF domain-containing protein [Bacteroidota bacterium]HMT35789.1 BLUF domain-containing protein [Chitinophagaceae bacterium]MBK6818664.1 BLUF domain-containing protein [Bacteroidota bacterium]MBK7040119.1 BLUF domain-containing protein [Bacteroidota bacterium]MBK7587017.1 BLUF domain-containing protein [Bacteroidota bacterium]
MNEEKIYQLSYVSTGCDSLRYEDIKNILESSNKNNSQDHITGILVYCNKHFFQIIEGNREAILEIFNKILIDSRHDNVIKIQEGYIDKRQFESWNMAFKSYNKELKDLDNFNNEQFYSYINSQLSDKNNISMKVLADFFDLNG